MAGLPPDAADPDASLTRRAAGSAPPSTPAHPIRPRSRRLGTTIALVSLVLIGALAWWLVNRPAPPAADASAMMGPGPGGGPPGTDGGGRRGPPTTVAIAAAATADMPVNVEALGTVTSAATVTVRPQVSGVLQQVLFREGQTVKAGDVIAVIDPQPFRIALMQAEGNRRNQEAQLANAGLTLTRFRTLQQQDSIATQDVDTQASLVKQLEGTLLASRAAESTARLNLQYTRVTAPVSGRLGLRKVDAGNTLSTTDTEGLAVITQLSPIDVAFSVPQDMVPEIQDRLREGAKLPVSAFDRSRTHRLATGEFATLDNQIDTTTGTIRAKARFANADGSLFPNQFVNVQMLLRTLPASVVVPVTAVRQGADGDFVYVLQDDRSVLLRKVKRGETDGERVVIRTGLKAGERVVTEGADRLKDGARVQLADADKGDAGKADAAVPAEGAASRPKKGHRRASDAAP
jgi:membrane fusion protein, multidrug efflux system